MTASMIEPNRELLELAGMIRTALIAADRQQRFIVAATLDDALHHVIALDLSGSIEPHPVEP